MTNCPTYSRAIPAPSILQKRSQGHRLLTFTRIARWSLTGAICLLLISCSSPEKDAEELLKQMQQAYKEGVSIPELESRAAREEQLSAFERVLSLSQRLEKKFPNTLVAQGIEAGQIDLGGLSLRQLREVTLPLLRRDLLAGSDPLTAVRVLAERVSDPAAASKVLVDLARSYDNSGRGREAESALADAFALTSSIQDRTTRVERLSAIAFGHANSSRHTQALEIAFSALAEAKQVADLERRSLTLSQISLSYYLLGAQERGYEALLSVPDKTRRRRALAEVSSELLKKNLAHQVVAASTSLFNAEDRADFLLEQAELANTLGIAPGVILLVDQALPLFSRSRSAQKRWVRTIQAASLLRRAGQTARALELLQGVEPQISSDSSLGEEAAKIALELAELNQSAEAIALGQRLTKEARKEPRAKQDVVFAIIAQAFCVADEPQLSLPLLKDISEDSERVRALSEAAKAAKVSGSSGFARRMLEDAALTLAKIPDSESKVSLSLFLRDAYVDVGQLEDARKLSFSLQATDKRWRTHVRSYHAQLLSKGFSEESLLVARSVNDASMRGLLLSETAKQFYRDNNRNDAFRIVEEAVAEFDQVKDSNRLRALIALVADSVLQINWPTYANKLIEKYKLDDTPVWLCRVASSFAETGQREEALGVLQKALASALALKRPEDRAQVLLRVGETLATLETVLDYDAQMLLSQILEQN